MLFEEPDDFAATAASAIGNPAEPAALANSVVRAYMNYVRNTDSY